MEALEALPLFESNLEIKNTTIWISTSDKVVTMRQMLASTTKANGVSQITNPNTVAPSSSEDPLNTRPHPLHPLTRPLPNPPLNLISHPPSLKPPLLHPTLSFRLPRFAQPERPHKGTLPRMIRPLEAATVVLARLSARGKGGVWVVGVVAVGELIGPEAVPE